MYKSINEAINQMCFHYIYGLKIMGGGGGGGAPDPVITTVTKLIMGGLESPVPHSYTYAINS